MRKKISIAVLSIFLSINIVLGQDMLPSDIYYNENIAVNNVTAEAPTVKIPTGPPGGGPTGGGIGGGNWVEAPVGSASIPLLVAGLVYVAFVCYRRIRKSVD